MEKKASAEKAVREIRRKTRRRFSAEEKVRIVIEGLRARRASPPCAAAKAPSTASFQIRWGGGCSMTSVSLATVGSSNKERIVISTWKRLFILEIS